MTRARGLAAHLVLLICLVFPAPAFCAGEYNVNFAAPEFYWGSVLSDARVPWVTGQGLVASGPWYIDTNHREGALLVGPLYINTPLNNASNGIPAVPDLAGATMRITLRFNYGGAWLNEYDVRKGGQVVFWFQSRLQPGIAGYNVSMPPRIANYVFSRNILAEATSGTTVQIPLTDSLNDWKCIGRNQLDTRPTIGSAAKYTCALDQAEFREALRTPINMGILFLLPRYNESGVELWWLHASFPDRTPTMGLSSFALSEFAILK